MDKSKEVDQQGRALLADIAAGSEGALTTFYGLYQHTVYRYAMSKLNDSHAAGDILADVMVQVWKSAGSFIGKSKVSTWLIGIAHHKVIDMYRKNGRAEFVEIDERMEDVSPIANLDDLMSRLSDSNSLRNAMATLPELYREVLHLVFFEDMNYAEIGQVVGVPEGTIKSRVFNAKKKLKEILLAAA